MLHQLSWLAPEPIPRSLLPEGETQDALADLAGFSLAKLDESGVKFRIHGLVQDVTREQQSSDETATSFRSALEVVKAAAVGILRMCAHGSSGSRFVLMYQWPSVSTSRPVNES